MSLSKPTIIFRDNYGHEWESYTEALVANALVDSAYLDEYKLTAVVTAIVKDFYIREKKHEIERVSETSESTTEA